MGLLISSNKHRIHTKYLIILSVGLCFLVSCQPADPEVSLPTPLPMPAFLLYVYPEPSTVISAEDYREKRGSRIEGSFFKYVSNAICVEMDGYELIEEGDFGLDREEYLARSSLIIDGVTWPRVTEPDVYKNELAEALISKIDPETGERAIIGQGGAGPYLFCWEILLNKGLHEFEFSYRKTSGTMLSYNWFFYID